MKLRIDQTATSGILLLIYGLLLILLKSQVNYITMCWLSIIDIALVAIYIVQKRVKIYDSRLIFLAILILYTVSQNFVYPFIANSSEYTTILYVRHSYSDLLMNTASVCTLLCINVLAIVLFRGGRNYDEQSREIAIIDDERIANIRSIAALLFALSLPFMAYKMFVYLSLFLATGYGESAKSMLPSLVKIISPYFFTSVVIGTSINLYQNRKNTVYDLAIIIFVMYSFLIGDRGGGVCFALFRVWEWALFRGKKDDANKENRPSIKKVVVVLICVFALLIVMQVVKTYRASYSGNIFEVVSLAFSTLGSSNFIVDDLLEFGGSMYPLIETIKRMSSESIGFACGLEYLDFFINMIPSSLGISSIYPHLANWLSGSSGYAGQGFSVIAEAYYNFSSFAWIGMILIGSVIHKIYYYDGSENNTIYSIMITALCMTFMGDIARRSIAQFGFTCLWYIIIPVLLVKMATIKR